MVFSRRRPARLVAELLNKEFEEALRFHSLWILCCVSAMPGHRQNGHPTCCLSLSQRLVWISPVPRVVYHSVYPSDAMVKSGNRENLGQVSERLRLGGKTMSHRGRDVRKRQFCSASASVSE